jgi:two-component system response regulator YesN
MTLGDYIAKVRMEKAKALLKNTEIPVSQIALRIGYPDQSYFTKVFRKIERCTPRAFRQIHSRGYEEPSHFGDRF